MMPFTANDLQQHALQRCLRGSTLVFQWKMQTDWTGDTRPYRCVAMEGAPGGLETPWYGRLQVREPLDYRQLEEELQLRQRYRDFN